MISRTQLLNCFVVAWFLAGALFGIGISLFAGSFQQFSGYGDGALYREWVDTWLGAMVINNLLGMPICLKRPGVFCVLVGSTILILLVLSAPVY